MMAKRPSAPAGSAPAPARRTGKTIPYLIVIALLVGLVLAVLAVGIQQDLSKHVFRYNTDIRVNQDLEITKVYGGAIKEGFQKGDIVLGVAGQQVTSLLEYREVLNGHEVGWVTVEVKRPGKTESLWLDAELVNRKLDGRFFVSNLLAISFVVMGVIVAAVRPRDKTGWLFLLTTLVLGLYFGLQNKETVGLIYIQIFAQAMAPGLIVHLFLTFPTERPFVRTRWWPVIYVPGLVLMALTMYAFAGSVAAGTGIWYSPTFALLNGTISYGLLTVSAIIALASVANTYREETNPTFRRQQQFLMVGLGCAIAASIIDLVLTNTGLMTPEISTFLLLITLPLPFAIGFAILRYRLLDVTLVLNRGVVYGLLTAILVALYLLLIGIPSQALGGAVSSQSYVPVVFLSALIIALLVNPLRSRIQAFIDRVFFRNQVDYQQALFQWSEELSTSIRFTDLAERLLHEIPRVLMLERTWLLVLNEEETYLDPLPVQTAEYDTRDWVMMSISVQEAGELKLDQPGRYILIQEESDEGIPHSWKRVGAQVALPLVSGGRLVGVFLLGRKLSGEVFGRQELDPLRTIANQAAIAIANARMYEEIHAFSQELEKKVQERTAELRHFVSVVYHEIRTPITAIQGYTSLLLDSKSGALDAKQQRFLETIDRNTLRLTDLVEDLSDISQLEDGRMVLHQVPLSLDQIVDETLASLAGFIEEKGLQVNKELELGTTRAMGDPQRILQILINLVGNACRYTPAGGSITLGATCKDGMIETTVTDTGIGIHPDELPFVFDKLWRSPDGPVQEQTGTGLGLSITKSLVELHGGEVWVQSTFRKGSTFGFTLPCAGQQSSGETGIATEGAGRGPFESIESNELGFGLAEGETPATEGDNVS